MVQHDPQKGAVPLFRRASSQVPSGTSRLQTARATGVRELGQPRRRATATAAFPNCFDEAPNAAFIPARALDVCRRAICRVELLAQRVARGLAGHGSRRGPFAAPIAESGDSAIPGRFTRLHSSAPMVGFSRGGTIAQAADPDQLQLQSYAVVVFFVFLDLRVLRDCPVFRCRFSGRRRNSLQQRQFGEADHLSVFRDLFMPNRRGN